MLQKTASFLRPLTSFSQNSKYPWIMLRQGRAEDSQTRGKWNEDLAPWEVTPHKSAPGSAPWTGEQRSVGGPLHTAAFPPMSTHMN